MKKKKYFNYPFLFLSLLMIQLLHSQRESPYKWSIAPVVGVKAIKTLVLYDFGVQFARTINPAQRLRLETSYRTSAPNLIQNWGRREMNMKSDIHSYIIAANYEWNPFVYYGTENKYLIPVKLLGGISYLTNPTYSFDVSVTEAVTWGSISFSPEEIGSVATTITTNNAQPFLGAGYDTYYLGKKLSFGVNGGVLYQGKPHVVMTATNMLKPTETQAERFESNLKVYQFSPFVQVFIQYNL
jgi:hypothetical protein